MKMWNYIILGIGLSILFEFAGVGVGGGILSEIGFSLSGGDVSFDFKNSSLWGAVFIGGILVGVVGGLVVGILTKSNPENYIILPIITGTLLLFIQVYIGIIKYASANGTIWISAIISLLLVPLVGGFVIAAYEHFRGTD